MKDDAVSAITPAPSRLLLLSHSEFLDSALHQYLEGCPACVLHRAGTLRPEHARFALALLDLGSYSHDQCLQLLRQFGDMPVALINAQPDQARLLIEMHPWIRGVFYRSTPRSNFIRGVEKLLCRYRQLTHSSQVIDELTLREKQILALAGHGLSNSAIAQKLHLSTHTIKSHVHNALRKLGASNRAQGASLVLAHIGEATP